jgi:hypothetical protein
MSEHANAARSHREIFRPIFQPLGERSLHPSGQHAIDSEGQQAVGGVECAGVSDEFCEGFMHDFRFVVGLSWVRYFPCVSGVPNMVAQSRITRVAVARGARMAMIAAHRSVDGLIKSFDRLRACPVLDTGTNGNLLSPFVVSLSNHRQIGLIRDSLKM